MTKRGIGDLLLDNGQITEEELKQAQVEQGKTGDSISKILLRLGLADENHIKNALELEYGVNYLALKKLKPDPVTAALLPEALIRQYEAIPVNQEGTRLTLAMVTPSDDQALSELKKSLSNWQIKPVVCCEDDFLDFVTRAFLSESDSQDEQKVVGSEDRGEVPKTSTTMAIQETDPTSLDAMAALAESEKSSFEAAADAAVMLLSQHIVSNAIKKGCSNIHIEPTEKEVLVHYRKEGVLLPPRKLPLALLSDLLKTYKNMTATNDTEARLPLDGRLKVELDGKPPTFFRLSIVAGAHGEHLVLWLD